MQASRIPAYALPVRRYRVVDNDGRIATVEAWQGDRTRTRTASWQVIDREDWSHPVILAVKNAAAVVDKAVAELQAEGSATVEAIDDLDPIVALLTGRTLRPCDADTRIARGDLLCGLCPSVAVTTVRPRGGPPWPRCAEHVYRAVA